MGYQPLKKVLSAEIKKQIAAGRKTVSESEKAGIIEAWRLGANAKFIRSLKISKLSEYSIKRIVTEAGEVANLGIDAEETHAEK